MFQILVGIYSPLRDRPSRLPSPKKQSVGPSETVVSSFRVHSLTDARTQTRSAPLSNPLRATASTSSPSIICIIKSLCVPLEPLRRGPIQDGPRKTTTPAPANPLTKTKTDGRHDGRHEEATCRWCPRRHHGLDQFFLTGFVASYDLFCPMPIVAAA